jgi:hypothetical protein
MSTPVAAARPIRSCARSRIPRDSSRRVSSGALRRRLGGGASRCDLATARTRSASASAPSSSPRIGSATTVGSRLLRRAARRATHWAGVPSFTGRRCGKSCTMRDSGPGCRRTAIRRAARDHCIEIAPGHRFTVAHVLLQRAVSRYARNVTYRPLSKSCQLGSRSVQAPTVRPVGAPAANPTQARPMASSACSQMT